MTVEEEEQTLTAPQNIIQLIFVAAHGAHHCLSFRNRGGWTYVAVTVPGYASHPTVQIALTQTRQANHLGFAFAHPHATPRVRLPARDKTRADRAHGAGKEPPHATTPLREPSHSHTTTCHSASGEIDCRGRTNGGARGRRLAVALAVGGGGKGPAALPAMIGGRFWMIGGSWPGAVGVSISRSQEFGWLV
jgi:hypothetical protein